MGQWTVSAIYPFVCSDYANTLKCASYIMRVQNYNCSVKQLQKMATSDSQVFSQLQFDVVQNFEQSCSAVGEGKKKLHSYPTQQFPNDDSGVRLFSWYNMLGGALMGWKSVGILERYHLIHVIEGWKVWDGSWRIALRGIAACGCDCSKQVLETSTSK